MEPKLTIGMATIGDYHGVWLTVQSLALYHPDECRDVELIVVSNGSPDAHAADVRTFLGWHGDRFHSVRLIEMPEPVGTTAPRQRVFDAASAPWVVCMDSHVMLAPGSLRKLLDYCAAHPDSRDLLSGPILWDNLHVGATHFRDEWRDEMWGVWDTDPRGMDAAAPPFEIPAMGLGLFCMRRDAWPGFNPDFRGFGGEEFYIHNKVRQRGGRCLCLPFLRWAHRFGRPDGVPYAAHLSVWNKARNYVIGLQELGMSIQPVYDMFVPSGKLPLHEWQQMVGGAAWPAGIPGPAAPPCGCTANTLEGIYAQAKDNASDINEHVPTLRELAAGLDTVVEFGVRTGISTAALLAGQPRRMYSFDINDSPQARRLAGMAGETQFTFAVGDSLLVAPVPCDLLFIDTRHTGEQLAAELRRHAPACRRYIALHDTEIFGEFGEDGKPGLLAAVRDFVRDNPRWIFLRHDKNNHGFTVLSCHPDDRPPVPPLWQRAFTFLGAAGRDPAVLGGNPGPLAFEKVELRLAQCYTCGLRTVDEKGRPACGKCGCPVELKASWPRESCPMGKWGTENEAA